MKTINKLLATLVAYLIPMSFLLAQGGPLPSAAMTLDRNGYQYIEATNPTSGTYSLTIGFAIKYPDGKRGREQTTAILDPGQTKSAFKCAVRAPNEEIYDIKILELRKMN